MRYEAVDPEVLRRFIEGSGLSYKENSQSWIFTCPKCDKAKKLYLSKKSGRFVCWRCKETDNYQGRPEFALADMLGEPLAEVSRKLYGNVSFSSDLQIDVSLKDFFGYGDEVDAEAVEHEVAHWPFDYYPIDHPFAERGRLYMKSRGIPAGLAKRYDIRYSPEMRRVYFPVSSNGMLYGWQGRLVIPTTYELEDGEEYEALKIISSKGMKREHLLMFADRLKGCDHAVVCEGPVDALKAHYCGGNVATMGKAISKQQVELLRNSGVKRLYLALDPDAADEMHRLVRELSGDMELFEMVPEGDGKVDLGAMSFEGVYKLFLHAPRIEPGRLFVFIDPRI